MSTFTSDTVAGRYHLGRQLGRGGMAVVHHGEDERLGREVAVKLLDRRAGPDDRGEDRFAREARRAASLNHPNIVQVHDTGVDADHPFIVMEFVDGPSLADVIEERAPLAPDEAVRIAASMCEALDAAHEAGIVHRDVKPSNVLFDPRGRLKLVDFGLAKAYAGDTITRGDPMGSAAYISPEQISDSPVDHRADLYSLGVVLYEMLTGVRPFKGDSAAATAVQRLARDPLPPSGHVELPTELDDAVLTLLARDADDRYGSAAEASAALRGALSDTATLPIAVAADEPHRRWWLPLLALLAVMVVGGLLVGSSDGGGAVTVPDVSGMTVAAATRVLEDAGLALGTVRTEPSDEPTGLIVEQFPEQGVALAEGAAVDLVVAGEPGTTEATPTPTPTSTPTPTAEDVEDDGTSGVSDTNSDETGDGTDTADSPAGEDKPQTPGRGGTPPGQGGEPPGRGNG